MFRFVKYLVIFKLLNPFQRGFSLIRFLLCIVVAMGLLYFYAPGLFSQITGRITGAAPAPDQSGGLLGGLIGGGDRGVGGVLDSLLGREQSAPHPGNGPADGGFLCGMNGGKAGYGPPSDFSGGTVTGNADLFASFAYHGLSANQLGRLPDSPKPPAAKPDGVAWQTVTSVVDGDTIAIGREKVRLIGIDAPEAGENDHLRRELDRIGAREQQAVMLHMGRQAAGFVRRVAEGRRCWLEFEGAGTRDQYGRILAYVHLEDGTNLNEAIVYEGYGKVYLGGDFRYLKRYLFLQDEAMRRGNGLWRK